MNDAGIRASGPASGDDARALLRDLDWIREAGPSSLRAAVHALCWRTNRATIDGFCTDPEVCAKILITARGVASELDARIATATAELDSSTELTADASQQRASLLRRRAAAESGLSACQTAMQLAALTRPRVPTASELADAIAEHRRRVHPEDACDADTALWQVIDPLPAAS